MGEEEEGKVHASGDDDTVFISVSAFLSVLRFSVVLSCMSK